MISHTGSGSDRRFLHRLINYCSTRHRGCARVLTVERRTSTTIVTECRRARPSDGLLRRLISALRSVTVGPITDQFINYSDRMVADHSSCTRVLCRTQYAPAVTPPVYACRVRCKEGNKKLRHREEHSASVVLSWCTLWHFSGEDLLMANQTLLRNWPW